MITRRRGYDRLPLESIVFGGGQERGLRPETLPVALIVGLGKSAEVAERDEEKRKIACKKNQSRSSFCFEKTRSNNYWR